LDINKGKFFMRNRRQDLFIQNLKACDSIFSYTHYDLVLAFFTAESAKIAEDKFIKNKNSAPSAFSAVKSIF